jgi:hypothetical protein
VWLVRNSFARDALDAAKVFTALVNDEVFVVVAKDPAGKLSTSVYRFKHDPEQTAAEVCAALLFRPC